MVEWWYSLDLASQILYCIAIPSMLILVIQILLMFFGLDNDADCDLEFDTSDTDSADGIFGENSVTEPNDVSGLESLHIFTFRGIIAFFAIFSWVGIVMLSLGVNLPISLLVATACGFAMMLVVAYLFKLAMRLKSDGTSDNRQAIGTEGKVYLTIPPSRSGEGKINVMLQGTYVERNAVTDETEGIPTGCEVIVVGTSGQTTLVVKRK